ncbi:RnfABCDGE type electron transport complex subunit D [Natranaerobius thermophilus]|uniref:Ion-translocating oxidoreductase complex subunit D n=1 Tax=Natranaerobius thermophilus (strain ATCC BAA-1301 / DSM 18059 / JW/NM-WN-LF) TaxID=457570 RepID=B2A143_NATTJ|nr:RnfABCDGE type electron transport complex subunit D [Natranaerobius thermophilus]ACB84666.1 electron transport complex, RnfABCDGE type, D subunit [Natranaerobius thermophilus JW/NM-WN-LF]
MKEKLVVSSSPHLRSPETIDSIMRDVLIALIPPFIVSIWLFGWTSIIVVAVATAVSMITESLIVHKSLAPRKLKGDLSAAVTGVIFGLSLPPGTPWWVVASGAFVAIFIAKQIFGGIGYNIFNPALVGRAFVVVAWPSYLTHWTEPFEPVDAASRATPLAFPGMTEGSPFEIVPFTDLFVGTIAGSLGETSALAITIGGIFLLIRGHIDFRVPLGFLGALALVVSIAGENALFHLVSGSAFFGAIFIATCMVTSPYTKTGKLIFGIGCGAITAILRMYAAIPAGVTYAVLLMNALVPFINVYTKPRVYGEVNNKK